MGGVNSGELPFMTILRLILELVLIIVLLADYLNTPYKIHFNRYFLGYLLYSAITIFWAPKPYFFIYKYTELLLLFIAFSRFSKGFENTMNNIQKILMINVILSALYFSKGFNIIDNSLPYQLRGAIFTLNPNDFGFLVCSVLLWKFINGEKQWSKYIFWFIVLILTQSRIFLGFVFVLSIVLLLRKKPFIAVLLGVITFFSDLPFIFLSFFQRSKSIADMSSLNGRVGFWELGIKHWLESPIFGHGWYTGHRFTQDIDGVRFSSNTFDSTLIDLLADLGVVGLLFIILMFISILKHEKVRLLTWALILKAIVGPSIQVLHPSLLILFPIFLYGKNAYNLPNIRLQSP